MFRKVSRMALVCLLVITGAGLDRFSERASAQHKKVPKEPFQIVDASTGKTIPEVLVIPLYSSYKGVFIAPEGPSRAIVHDYLDNPFVYRSGEPFNIKQPRVFTGLPLLFVFVGEGKDLGGILVIGKGYRPLWTDYLWCCPWDPKYKRELQLSPISESQWSKLLEKELGPLLKNDSTIRDNCEMWDLKQPCDLDIRYNKKERELVRSFLQPPRKISVVEPRRNQAGFPSIKN